MLGCMEPPRRSGHPPGRSLSSLAVSPPGPHGGKALFRLFSEDLDRSEAGLGRTVGLSRYRPARITDRRAAGGPPPPPPSPPPRPLSPPPLAPARARGHPAAPGSAPGPPPAPVPGSPARGGA